MLQIMLRESESEGERHTLLQHNLQHKIQFYVQYLHPLKVRVPPMLQIDPLQKVCMNMAGTQLIALTSCEIC